MKFINYLLPCLLCLSITACDKSAKNETPVASAPTTVQASASSSTNQQSLPTYTALTDSTYPPFEVKNADGTIGGMEIDIFNAIAKNQGFKVEYLPHEWDGIFESLNNEKENTLIISAVAKTDEAKANSLLSDVYYISPYRVASMSTDKITNWKTQPRIGISDNEDSADDLPKTYGVDPKQLVHYKTVFAALTGLVRGEVDSVIADSTVMQFYAHSDTFKRFKIYQQDFDYTNDEGGKLVFAVKKGNEDLLQKINTGLANIKKSGELNQILLKYHQNPEDVEKKLKVAAGNEISKP